MSTPHDPYPDPGPSPIPVQEPEGPPEPDVDDPPPIPLPVLRLLVGLKGPTGIYSTVLEDCTHLLQRQFVDL